MPRDILEQLEPFLSEDRRQWAKLASDVGYRRLQLLLLREILIELRTLNSGVTTSVACEQVDIKAVKQEKEGDS